MIERIMETRRKNLELLPKLEKLEKKIKARAAKMVVPDELAFDTVIKYKKESRTIKGWAEHIGISMPSIRFRLKEWGLCEKSFSGKKEVSKMKEDYKRLKRLVYEMRGQGKKYKEIIAEADKRGLKNTKGASFKMDVLSRIWRQKENGK